MSKNNSNMPDENTCMTWADSFDESEHPHDRQRYASPEGHIMEFFAAKGSENAGHWVSRENFNTTQPEDKEKLDVFVKSTGKAYVWKNRKWTVKKAE